MRLICPNCGAQYEVPESVIPETGRDVQCSSCGHTWFQRHPHQDSAAQDAGDHAQGDDPWDDAADESLFGDDDDDDTAAAAQKSPPQQTTAADTGRSQVAAGADDPATDTADELADGDDFDDDPEEEWQGFPSDPRLTAAPRPADGLRADPEDPVSRIPEVEEDDYEEDPARDLPPSRRGLDTSVADLLREEAEREARARAAERGSGLESQPDLGLDSPTSKPSDADALRRQEDARLQMARLRGEAPAMQQPAASPPPPPPSAAPPFAAPPLAPSAPPAQPAPPQRRQSDMDDDRIAAAAAAAVADSRRGLLPDIEEINSSLRSTSDRRPARADDHDTPGQTAQMRDNDAGARRAGFSRGFSVTLLIAMLLLALYIFAPALAEALPAAAPVVDAYVAAVDQLRLVLDAQVQNLSRWLADVAGSTGG